MSRRRVEFGIGTGWYDAEHIAYGIPFPGVGEQFERFEEQLAIITGLWATPRGNVFSFDGTYYHLSDCPALPKPTQGRGGGKVGPPVIVGGFGAKRTLRIAAQYADEFNVDFRSLEDTGIAFDRVREACAADGRSAASMIYSAVQVVNCGRDDAEAKRRADAIHPELAPLWVI